MLELRDSSASIAKAARIAPRTWIVFLALLALAAAQPAWAQETCTWNQNGPGQWDNPSNWNDCTLGNGNPAGTPGPADHAVIGNIAPLADIDLGSSPRTVDRITLSAGRIFGNVDLSVNNRLIWTGGTIDGGGGATLLTLGLGSINDFSASGLMVLARRDLTNLGVINWVNGDIQLNQDAEIDNQGVLRIDSLGVVRAPDGIPAGPRLLTSDGSPLARLHNSSAPGARIEKVGNGLASFAPTLQFDNGNLVQVDDGTLQVMGPGGDFGTYQVAAGARIEFGMPTGVTRELTGVTAVTGNGTLHKFGDGQLEVTGGYALTGLTEVVGGTLVLDTAASPLILPALRVSDPGILSSPSDIEVSNGFSWDGGEIIGTGGGSSLTLAATAVGNINLGDLRPDAFLRSIDLVNLGSLTLAAVATSPTSFWLDAASIDNQASFTIDNNSGDNLRIDCLSQNCGSFTNGPAATLTLNDQNGIIAIGSELSAFNNAGLVNLLQGCGAIGAPGSDTGTWRYAGTCTLWFNPRPDTERVLQASAILEPQGLTSLQLGGTVRVEGASRSFGPLIIDQSATLYGPAAITLTGATHWRGLIEGASLSESVTIAYAAVVQIGPDPGDAPTLYSRTLYNDGGLLIDSASLHLGGLAEIRSNGAVSLGGTPAASGSIVCADVGDCGSLINQATGAVQSGPAPAGPPASVATGIGFDNAGALIVAGGTLLLDANFNALAGSLVDVLPGAVLRRDSGSLILDGGILSGLGSVQADVELDAVTVAPAGPAPGNLTILGNLSDSASTVYQMGIVGSTPPAVGSASPRGTPGYDRLTVTGLATLGGTLDVLDLGYTPSGAEVFDLLVFANRVGAPIAGANPYSGLGFSLFNQATRVRLATVAGGGCEWNPAGLGPDNWDNPAKWNNCGGGVGPGPGPVGTPGASDTAIITGGVVNLNVPVSVQELQLTAGVIQGPSNLTIANTLLWTGGRFQGSGSEVVTLSPGSIATLNGGQHTVDGRRFVLDGVANWSTGLIELANAAIFQIGPAGTLNSNPAGAFESVFGSGTGTAELRNFGAIVKLGVGASGIGQSVQYGGPGSITVTGGEFIVAASSAASLDGSYTADVGAALHFVASNRSFGSIATLGGAGTLIFGDAGPSVSENTLSACITAGANLAVRHARLVLNCGIATSLGSLLMIDDAAIVEGSSPITVSGNLVWGHGTIRGGGTQTFTLANGAAGSLPAPRGIGMPRVLDGRRFINHGSLSWVGDNAFAVNNGASLENESDGAFTLLGPGVRNLTSDLALAPRVVNRGTLTVAAGAQGVVDVDFDNDGLVQLQDGRLQLLRNGSDSGDYVVDAATDLEVLGGSAVRIFGADSTVNGAGRVRAVSGANLTVNGGFAPIELDIGESATVALDTPGIVALHTLEINQGTLTGNDEIHVTHEMRWDGGALAGSGASPGPLVIDAGATLDIDAPAHVLDSRELVIAGAAVWHFAPIRVPQNQAGRIVIAATGSLVIDTFKSVAYFGCDVAPCTAQMEVAGQLENIGNDADFQLSSPLRINGGTLTVEGDTFAVSALDLDAGAIEVIEPATLQTSLLTVNGGVLSGTGLISGAVANVGGVVRPGSSPGQLDIFGSYTQGPGATLEIEVAGLVPGTNSDFLFASGAVSLDGTLNVVDAGHTLVSPETLDVLFADGGLSGTFATTNSPYPGYIVSYSGFAATLTPGGTVPLVVNSTVDPGDGTCDGSECTLREAIAQANGAAGPDVIEFNIPAPQCTGPAGACVIQPLTPLPAITTPILIDGYSQPGAVPNSQLPSAGLGTNAQLRIELDGTLASGSPGLSVNAPGSLVTIAGLAIYRFGSGIVSQGPGDAMYQLLGNYIGVRADGSAAPPGQLTGVSVQGGFPVVGDATAAGMNLISGNGQHGIAVQSLPPLASLVVQGNLIGTTADGLAARPNGQHGIIASTNSAIAGIFIGGNLADERNVVSGNTQDGIRFDCSATVGACFNGTQVIGNFIGPAADGSALGNGGNGVNLSSMDDGRVFIGNVGPGTGNRIAFNGGNGILATFGGVGRGSFLRNDIYQNGQQGIDLGGDGRTANDAGDPDTGPNGRLNFPQFTSYTAPGGTSAVIDVILDTPDIGGNYPARVDFYKAVEDEPGVWLGTTTCAQPNLSCPASFAFPGGVSVTPDDVVVGVVTDAFGKSSEASFYATTTVVTAPDAVLGASYTATVTVTSSAPFSILGDVNVSDGVSESCVATLSVVGPGQSTGSCPLNAVLPLGPRTITASYLPKTPPPRPFSNSSGTDPMVITGIVPTITSISPTSGPDTGGTLVTITGSDFLAGGTTIVFGPSLATGVTCTTTQCTVISPAGTGTVSVRATTAAGTSADTPADDYSYIPSSVPTSTTISGIAPLGGVVVGQAYTVSVLVTSSLPPRGLTVTTGIVEVRQLSDGTSCTIDLSLATSCSLTPTSALTTAVRAYYLGSGSLQPSQSSAQAYPVSRANTAIQIVSDTPDPSLAGEPVLVTVSLGVVAPGAGTPTGEVLVTDGIASCGFSLPNLSCLLGTKALGAATLEARYLGDANFNASLDTESHTITVDGADLTISKFNGLRLVPGGVPSAYVLLVRNLGPQNVANARVTDILPPQLGNASWTCSAGTGASCPASGTGTVDALVSLNAGSSLSFTLTVTAQANPEQVVSNTATVTPPPNAPDPVPGNNSATDVDPTGVFGEGFETEVE